MAATCIGSLLNLMEITKLHSLLILLFLVCNVCNSLVPCMSSVRDSDRVPCNGSGYGSFKVEV